MNIKISKNAHACAACGNDFQHGATINSTVKKWEGALHREDFCGACWNSERNKAAYSVWRMLYHDPKIETEAPAEVFSPLRQLFYEAVEEESRVDMARAFLAAGLLRRQKVFRLIKESDEADGSIRVTLYTDRIGNRLIEVPDPDFTYAELETARVRLLERLRELEAAADASEAATESEVPSQSAEQEQPAADAGPEAAEPAEDVENASDSSAGEDLETGDEPGVASVGEAVHAQA